jgi:hypothetical protein
LVGITKTERDELSDSIDAFANNSFVEKINYIISDNIPPNKIFAKDYTSESSKTASTRKYMKKGVRYSSRTMSPLPLPLPPPSSLNPLSAFSTMPPPPPPPPTSSKRTSKKRKQTSPENKNEITDDYLSALDKALSASLRETVFNITKKSRKKPRTRGGKRTINNKNKPIWHTPKNKTYKKKH